MPDNHGFSLVRQENIPEIRSNARIFEHKATGARVMSLENDDENKVFGACFRTPPSDSTGVPHILEHSVLCGSRKYPVKEPFVELLKGSLQTFLNAFTFPDKTCYPVASANLQDFHNLIDVYLDAVFYPRITENIFKQEGWHYELDDPDGPLSYKGVVFNEMKGAYSSPDSVLHEYSQQCIFPDTTYGLDSGGNPERIPDLTYEAFLEFHRTLYHPANCWFWFYGDDDPDTRLEILAGYLNDFGPLEVESSVPLQAGWRAPRRVERRYAGDEEAKTMVTVNWLLTETSDVEANLSLRILEEILVAMPSSPLRKRLIESGLGEDLAGIGLEEDLRQMYFSTGLKGVDPERAPEVEELVLETLEELAGAGIEANMVEAALNTVEFDFRENNTGRFPRGLLHMIRSLSTWLYDADPLALLRFEAPLSSIKSRHAAGEKVFEEMIRRLLLENSHRATLVLRPDPELAERRESIEKARLAGALESMDAAERQRVMTQTKELKAEQQRPDEPRDLARIPRLEIADLPGENRKIPAEAASLPGGELLTHDLETTSICYLDLAFDARGLDTDLLPLCGLFGRALTEAGTGAEDYVSFNRRIKAKTGGIACQPMFSEVRSGPAVAGRFIVRAKATAENVEPMFEILADALLGADLSNRERIRQMVLEEKARLEQQVVPAGHVFVMNRLGAHFTPSGHARELSGGVSRLKAMRKLAASFDEQWPLLEERLLRMRRTVLTRTGLVANLTADESLLGAAEGPVRGLAEALPEGDAATVDWSPADLPAAEGLAIPAQVNYVGKAVDLRQAGFEVSAADLAVARYLRASYLWDHVRVQGGAYGAFCSLDYLSSVLTFASYRDPNLDATIEVFDNAAGFLEGLELGDDERAKAVVGAVGDMDAYQLPDAKGFTSLTRHLTGRTEEELQQMRETVMGAGEKDFRRFAEAVRALAREGRVAVMGSAESLKGSRLNLETDRVL